MEPIYLDHLATTPLDPRVFDAMRPFFFERFGNAASRHHRFGKEALQAVEEARHETARAIGAHASEIVFTSGATEAINLALKGAAEMYGLRGRHLVTSRVEHRAVLDTCAHLETLGFDVDYVDPDGEGRVSVEAIEQALRPDTILVALIWANNEVGTLSPVAELGELCRRRDVLFFLDATQAVGKVPVDVDDARASLLALSAHKLYGPKGTGALYVRRRDPRVRLAPQLHGGGHERGLRSGTLAVPGIVGLGAACALAVQEMPDESARLARLRDRLEAGLFAAAPDVARNGPSDGRLAGVSNLSFGGVDVEDVLVRLGDQLALSSGSACTSATLQPSHVLTAMGLAPQRIAGSLRFGLGRGTTTEEVERAIELVAAAVLGHRAAHGNAPA